MREEREETSEAAASHVYEAPLKQVLPVIDPSPLEFFRSSETSVQAREETLESAPFIHPISRFRAATTKRQRILLCYLVELLRIWWDLK